MKKLIYKYLEDEEKGNISQLAVKILYIVTYFFAMG